MKETGFLLMSSTIAGVDSNRFFATVLLALIVTLIVLVVIALRKKPDSGTTTPPVGDDVVERVHVEVKPKPEPVKKHEDPVKDVGSKKEEKPVLMGSLARKDEPVKTIRTEPSGGEVSIDKRYAALHGQWQCRYCETLNDDALSFCQACSHPRD